MKVGDYSVFMNADYFAIKGSNVALLAKQESSKLSTTRGSLESGESEKTQNIQQDKTQKNGTKELTRMLTASLLQNMSMLNIGYETASFESQELYFQTLAYIKTDVGEIELNLDVTLSQSFAQYHKIDFSSAKEQLAALYDPLVIEFGGTLPSLGATTFSFDIDADGQNDQISTLGNTSAFLALDKNSNGLIDNGFELFGAKSGDGFGELRTYDDDKNGWIDKNDKIFEKLRIWQKTDGKDKLIAIGEAGIGAIFLGGVSSSFGIKNQDNQMLGAMRKSGFFLFENGNAGGMSHIDLAVFNKEKEGKNSSTLKINGEAKKLLGINTYKVETSQKESPEGQLEKLEKMLVTLEEKLRTAKRDDEKATLQGQISVVQAQIMNFLLLQH